jgi:hypothetical protein
MRDCSWIPRQFENIHPGDFECSSDRTDHLPHNGYNCIAFAAGKKDKWWWPINIPGAHWPEGLPRDQVTLANFISAFETEKYFICDNGDFEDGYEKVAIFVDDTGEPTHAARSLPEKVWTSKMGKGEDIKHRTLREVEGRAYGKATAFLKRPLLNSPQTINQPNGFSLFLKRILGMR